MLGAPDQLHSTPHALSLQHGRRKPEHLAEGVMRVRVVVESYVVRHRRQRLAVGPLRQRPPDGRGPGVVRDRAAKLLLEEVAQTVGREVDGGGDALERGVLQAVPIDEGESGLDALVIGTRLQPLAADGLDELAAQGARLLRVECANRCAIEVGRERAEVPAGTSARDRGRGGARARRAPVWRPEGRAGRSPCLRRRSGAASRPVP
jgi:hypothetical protein